MKRYTSNIFFNLNKYENYKFQTEQGVFQMTGLGVYITDQL